MFHAPTTESKQTGPLWSRLKTEPRKEISPHVGTFSRHASLGSSGSGTPTSPATNTRPQLAHLHSTYGNQAVLRMLSQPVPAIQTKLTVNQPGDPFEQEADRVADQVMRMTAPAIQRKCSSCAEEDKLQRKCAECTEEEKKKEEGIHRKQTHTGPEVAPPVVHDVLRSPGRQMDAVARSYMEPRFGYDFSAVRLHTDAVAAESARAVNALAYSSGRNIAFAAGQYDPASEGGRHLLAHELAHVVQQGQGSSHGSFAPATIQRQPKPGSQQPPSCTPPASPARQLPADCNTPENIQALAEILWHEMGNEVPESIAVGSIVINRLLRITKLHKVGQLLTFERKPDPPQNVLDLACKLLTGQYADTTNGSENYFSPRSMPDASNTGCCAGQSGPCNGDPGKTDCGGGLQTVPGTDPPQKVFFPKWARPSKLQPQPQGTKPMYIQVYQP